MMRESMRLGVLRVGDGSLVVCMHCIALDHSTGACRYAQKGKPGSWL